MTEPNTSAPRPNDLPATAGAPHSLKLDGKDYPVRPMNFLDIAEFEVWAQDYYLDRLERVLAKSKADDEYKRNRRNAAAALAERLGMNLSPAEDPTAFDEMDKITRSMEGVTRLMWISIRDASGNPTIEQMARWMADDAVKALALRSFNRANGNEESTGPKGLSVMEAASGAAMAAVTLASAPLSSF